jgi:hypothetical protein
MDHTFNIFLGKAALIISNSDGLGLASATFLGSNGKDRVLIDLEGDLNLGGTTWGRWDTSQIEFTKKMVVLNQSTFSFINGNFNGCLHV